MKINNKRTIYIALFIVLGVLLGFVVRALVETWYINKLLDNFPKYSLGHTWAYWFGARRYFFSIVLVLSLLFGYFQGKFWWRLVYEEKKLDPFFNRLKSIFYG